VHGLEVRRKVELEAVSEKAVDRGQSKGDICRAVREDTWLHDRVCAVFGTLPEGEGSETKYTKVNW
jgi:hypothetical protein